MEGSIRNSGRFIKTRLGASWSVRFASEEKNRSVWAIFRLTRADPSLNGSEDSSQRKTAGCGRSFCTEENCDRPAWSGSLCQRHYEAELKRRHDYRVPARSNDNGYGYDVRFCSLFTNELEHLGFPCYPEPHWFGALRRADHEFATLGPRKQLRPALCATQANAMSGTRELGPRAMFGGDGQDDIARAVGMACDKWLHRRGILSPRLY